RFAFVVHVFFFFQAEDGIRDATVTGVQTCALPISIGWLGVFLTGSVTSSAALFGKLQQVSATQTGLNPVLTTSANLFGGVTGKRSEERRVGKECRSR